MADKVWKVFERTVSKFFGSTRNALSGGNSKITRSDSLHNSLFIECKYRSNDALWTLFLDTRLKADKEGKVPVVCTKKKGSEGFLITIHSGDFDGVIAQYLSGRSRLVKPDRDSMEELPGLRPVQDEDYCSSL